MAIGLTIKITVFGADNEIDAARMVAQRLQNTDTFNVDLFAIQDADGFNIVPSGRVADLVK